MSYVVGLSSLSKVKNYFILFFLSRRGGERVCVFAVFFAPIPEKGIPDCIAHGPITVFKFLWYPIRKGDINHVNCFVLCFHRGFGVSGVSVPC